MLFVAMRLNWCLKFPLRVVKCLSCVWKRSNPAEIQCLFLNQLREREKYYITNPFHVVCCVSVGYNLFDVFLKVANFGVDTNDGV